MKFDDLINELFDSTIGFMASKIKDPGVRGIYFSYGNTKRTF